MRWHVRTQVLVWLCALAAIAYLQRNLGVAESTMRTRIQSQLAPIPGETEKQREARAMDEMGLVQGVFFWSYALFQIPGGWLCQRWGPRVGLSFFCLTWSIATGLTGYADQVWALCLIRFLSGVGQAAALPCIAEVVAVWFPQYLRARATGWVSAMMQTGALLNAFATGPILEVGNLRTYFLVLAAPGLIWAAGFYYWYRDRPAEFTNLDEQEALELPMPRASQPGSDQMNWLRLLTSLSFWLISAQQFCRAAGYIFFGSWFATYMQATRGIDVKQSGIATGSTFAGVLIGALVGGIISDWILNRTGNLRWARQGVAILSMVLCAVCILSSFAISGDSQAVIVMSVALMTLGAFFSGVAGPAGYTVTIDIAGKHVAPVFGGMNMAGNFGAALFAQIIPKLLGPTKDQWTLVIIVFAGLYLGAAFFWALLDPRRTVFEESPPYERDARKG